MFSGSRLIAGGLFLVSAALAAPQAHAVTVSLAQFDAFSRSDIAGAQSAAADFMSANKVKQVETFEDLNAWGNGGTGASNPTTSVGTFTALGDAGSGKSVVGSGRDLQVRGDNDMAWGRYNTNTLSAGILGGNWLDSNDNTGMTWTISGIGKFNAVGFFLTDIADVGGTFSLKAGDTVFSSLAGASGKLANGNVHFVSLLLDEMVDNLTLTFGHNRTNDGFGLDGAMVAVAPVPLPPAAALLLGGLGLLGAIGWRRRAAATPA